MGVGGDLALISRDHRQTITTRRLVYGDRVETTRRQALEGHDRGIADCLGRSKRESMTRVGPGTEGPRAGAEDVLVIRRVPSKCAGEVRREGARRSRRRQREHDRHILGLCVGEAIPIRSRLLVPRQYLERERRVEEPQRRLSRERRRGVQVDRLRYGIIGLVQVLFDDVGRVPIEIAEHACRRPQGRTTSRCGPERVPTTWSAPSHRRTGCPHKGRG